ncbi:hypothetical protein [Bacillus rubiinfantis]|uniref:hypothetical protein n=1 Tax=Bacillus rubiinfantis TaxID=1499680 RepID=UPI000AC60A85|nr:hypothetical protein [Bacillus rubiinfantis]
MKIDFKKLEQLGDELRGIGHKRRELVEKIYQEVQEGDSQSSKELYQELSQVSNQAIEIIQQQKHMIDDAVGRL